MLKIEFDMKLQKAEALYYETHAHYLMSRIENLTPNRQADMKIDMEDYFSVPIQQFRYIYSKINGTPIMFV